MEVWRIAAGVQTWEAGRYRGGLQACRHGSIEVLSSRALKAGCKRVDVEVFASRDRELRRHAAGLRTWRCKVWSSGAVEACCRRADVEVFASRDSELGRHAARLGMWSDGGVEVYCRRADVEAQRYE